MLALMISFTSKLFQSTPSGWRETCSSTSLSSNPNEFQSTPSGWRETFIGITAASETADFNPLPPGGGRPTVAALSVHHRRISIHSLRVEGDPSPFDLMRYMRIFQSTPSGWRETAKLHMFEVLSLITYSNSDNSVCLCCLQTGKSIYYFY